jgi:DNA mismatch repair protein MutS
MHVGDEQNERSAGDQENISSKIKRLSLPQMQLSIFDVHTETFEEIRKLLEGLDINRLTPVEALLKLQEIKSKLK